MQNVIDEAESVLLHTYNRFPVVFDHGDGVRLYDTNNKEYLDFVSGIGVFALGYNVKSYNDALKAQIDKITHTSNYYYNVPAVNAAKAVTKAFGMDRIFFTNSGAEALEGAVKTARKYAYLKDGKTDHEIIAMEHSFHGRTMGALSITGTPKYREPFEPMIGNVKFAQLNNLQSVLDLVNDKTCAIILEPVQGEGGIFPASKEFLEGIKKVCDEKDILLIFDEVQCGMGRTGYMCAWQRFNIKPDIMTVAKALGCGVPVGAFLMTDKVAKGSLVAGDHGTTYGGNPLVCAAICEVFRIYEEKKIPEHAGQIGEYLYNELDKVMNDYDFIIEHRGIGLMQGLVLDRPAKDIINKALEKGLVLINAGEKVIRFLPPLVIQKSDVDEMISILRSSIDELQ